MALGESVGTGKRLVSSGWMVRLEDAQLNYVPLAQGVLGVSFVVEKS